MKSRYLPVVVVGLLLLRFTPAFAGDQKATPSPAPLSKESRLEIIHTFTDDLVFAHTDFPLGKVGLTLKNGVITPDANERQKMVGLWGAALKPGDRAIISAIIIKPNYIRFEINGGPTHKKKWYQHIQLSGMGGEPVPLDGTNAAGSPTTNTNFHGSFVDLVFDPYVPDLTTKQIQEMLHPALDFNAKSALQAYLDTVPPKVREAIQQHHVLVGMNHDMVLYAKGLPPKKDREKDGDTEYEEWIYGEPPQQVDFVRFVGDEVVRVETMTVTGQKVVRTEKEVQVAAKPASQPEERPANAPTLRRPGEAPDPNSPENNPGGTTSPAQYPPPPMGGDPGIPPQ